ncbi:MAG: glutamate 5-kinase [Planctomycetota bacterium]
MESATILPHRRPIASARRIVIKIGSTLLADLRQGTNQAWIEELAGQVAALRKAGREVILVTSGAVAAGTARLGIPKPPTAMPLLQAAAAVGQGILMRHYAEAFARHEIPVGQMLLTRDGMDDRVRYLNARNTLLALLELGSLPIVNENDTIMVEEIRFGDNDQLSALVAGMAEAEALVILSDIEGLHQRPPAEGPSPVIEHVPAITPEIEARVDDTKSPISRGGMTSKLLAAKRASASGVPVVIASGRRARILEAIFEGRAVGTLFSAEVSPLSAKKRWIAARRPAGSIRVDAGAKRALARDGKSLLAIGVVAADEAIAVGDSVSLVDEAGGEFARGLSNFSGAEILRIQGERSDALAEILGYACATTVVHRDNLVLTEDWPSSG